MFFKIVKCFSKLKNVFQNCEMFFKIVKCFLKIESPYTQDVTSAIFDQAMFYVDY